MKNRSASARLITAALKRAIGKGINPIFLECLKKHEQIYEKHGFKRLDGVEASVIDVKRTMIAMELQPEAIAKITARLSDRARDGPALLSMVNSPELRRWWRSDPRLAAAAR